MSKFRNASLLQPDETVTDEQLTTEISILSFERALSRIDRRSFLTSAGMALGATAIAGTIGCSSGSTSTGLGSTTTATAVSIGDVLNFALNLEYLEASFYLMLTTGTGLPSTMTGTSPGSATGVSQVTFTLPGVQDVAIQLAADEMAHVQYLRATMTAAGITPVDMPSLNLGALGAVTNDAQFLAIARALETVGTSAYEGAASFLVSNAAVLDAAVQIHATEGQHEGALRQFCVANNVTSPAVDANDRPPVPVTPFNPVSPSPLNIFNTSATTGLNTARSTSAVLQIVYAAPGQSNVSSGGFYPMGMNGNIKNTGSASTA